MKSLLWNWLGGFNFKKKTRVWLFLMISIILYGFLGYVVWLIIGRQIFGDHIDWMLCFIGYPAILIGFLTGILFVYKKE